MGGAIAFVALMFAGIGGILGWIARDLSFKAEVVDEAIQKAGNKKENKG
jgi:hypothetical protein